jgi:hypothetical protein
VVRNKKGRSKEPIRDATSGQIKGIDQRRNVREIKGVDQRRKGRSKEPIRDATSEEIKGTDHRRKVRGDQRSQIKAANQEASNQRTNQDKESTRK